MPIPKLHRPVVTPARPSTGGPAPSPASLVEAAKPVPQGVGPDVPAHITGAARSNRPIRLRLDAGHGKLPLDKHALRVHARVDGKLSQLSFEHALPSKPAAAPGTYLPVTAKAVEAAWHKALAVRSQQLALLLSNPDAVSSASPVTPEDGSVQVAAYHMGFGAMDQAAEGFVEQMADIGRVEGFRAVVRLHDNSTSYLSGLLGREEENNTTFVKIDAYHDIWSEDAAEVHRDRSIGVPPPMPEGMNASSEILKSRIARFCPEQKIPRTDDAAKLYAVLQQHAPQAAFSVLGQVFARDAQLTFVGLALASRLPVRAGFCALEGGNMLVGTTREGKTCAFVGRDSFELSRRMMQKELGKKLDDAFVTLALSKDLGLPPEHIHVVEQPSVYHLDVKMIPIAPGEVIVNDSAAAARLVHEWVLADLMKTEPRPPRRPSKEANARYASDLDTWKVRKSDLDAQLKNLDRSSKMDAAGEARTQADLEKAGFQVHRIPAVFPWVGMAPMSFINAEQGRGKDGNRFYISLGGDKRGESFFLQQMKKIGADIDRFYFLDRGLTFNTLQAGGGINCRCKPEAVVP